MISINGANRPDQTSKRQGQCYQNQGNSNLRAENTASTMLSFLKDEMNIKSCSPPDTSGIPKVTDIVQAMTSTKNDKFKQMINDLATTDLDIVKKSVGSAPGLCPRLAVAMWTAAKQQQKQVHAPPLQSNHLKKRKTITNRDEAPPSRSNKKRHIGRKIYSSNWTVHEIKILLDAVGQVLPTAKPMWEKVRILCAEKWNSRWMWSADSCRRKFQRLCYVKEITSRASRRCPEMSGLISRAKKLKRCIARNTRKFEIIDVESELSDYDFESESESEVDSEVESEAELVSENEKMLLYTLMLSSASTFTKMCCIMLLKIIMQQRQRRRKRY